MGRQRKVEGEDAVTIRVLEWCGKYLPPLGMAPQPALEADGFDYAEYQRIRTEKIALYDDSVPGESEMVRRPNGSNAAVD